MVCLMYPIQSGFQCPTCKKSYGIRTGDMPPGTMNVAIKQFSLPGHEGCNTIEITYNFKPGVQVSNLIMASQNVAVENSQSVCVL